MQKTLRLYEAALSRTAALILVVDRDGVTQFFNAACQELTGFSLDEVVGRPFWDLLIPSDHVDGVKEQAQKLSSGDFPNDHENDWLTKSGERVPIRWHNTCTVGDDGEIEYLIGTGVPVAELRAAERAAEDEKRRLESFVAALPDIFFVIDRDGRYLDVQSPDPSLLAAPREQLLGSTIHDWLPPDFSQRVLEAAQAARESSAVQVIRYSLDVEAGQRFFSARLSATHDGNTLIIVRDETQVEQARVEAESARDAAQAASRSKSTFLATMSHEIRTPLNGVIGFAHLLLEDETIDHENRGYAQTIADSGQRLLSLLNDVLDLAKIEAGRITVRDDEVDLEEMCAQAIDAFAAAASRKGLRLELAVDPRLPRRGIIDGRRAQQILSNLISNAVKFTDSGFVRLRMSAVDKEGQTFLRALVEDSGIGLSLEDQERVFQPFEQGDTDEMAREYGGTGLGLSISRQLAELLGGSLQVESQAGQGARFWADLPLRLPQGSSVVRAHRPAQATGSLVGASALIVDDTQTNRHLYESMLTRWGADVATVASGRKALEMLETRAFDIVLLDYHMPGLSGGDTARLIRTSVTYAGAPLLLVSSVDSVPDADLDAFDDWLVKPAQSETLLATIQRLLAGSAEPAVAAPPPAPKPRHGERGVVLVVEDEQMNARLLQRMLERAGYEADIAVDGVAALEVLALPDVSYDAILLDVMMPRMDGLTMMRTLHERQPDHPPVVVVSARAFDQQRREMLDAGASAYITKPVYRDELFDALTRVLPARAHPLRPGDQPITPDSNA